MRNVHFINMQSAGSYNINKRPYFWSKTLISLCILAIVFYMYFSQFSIEQSYSLKWLADDSTNVPIFNDISVENHTEDILVKRDSKKGLGKEGNNVYITSSQANKIIPDKIKDDQVTTIASIKSVLQTKNYNKRKINKEDLKVRTILQWSSGSDSPFYHMGQENTNFVKLSCPYANCFVTDDKRYFKNITEYDAIIFNGNNVIYNDREYLPQYRSQEQIYVFGATESAQNNPACNPVLDNFFNWTYTYRLDSDVRWSYIVIYDMNGIEVGPKPDMIWPEKMDPIDEETKAILDGKSKTAAWFVSHCKTLSKREDFAEEVKSELKKLDMSVGIYGKCGKFTCPRSIADRCYSLIKRDYHFYFSFENSFEADYVTEKLLTALNNFAIPIVFGGADYSRYLPPGSYLNGRELGPEKLAFTMKEIIYNRTRYHDFFRWRNHFRYKQGENDTEICNICTALNDPRQVGTISLYENFRDWWYAEWETPCRVDLYP